jgi:Zn-dependent M28 family amino/carboxypeptidase
VPNSAARDSAAAYIAHTLEALGAEVSVQPFRLPDPYSERTLHLINVIARFEPKRERRVMLASHYDSRPWADQEPDSTLHTRPIAGAVDGALSTGILLEMGRLVGTAMPADIGVDLVFFDGEDYGREGELDYYLLGSKNFVRTNGGYRPEKGILLDMVGGVGTRAAREGYSSRYATALVDTVFARAGALGLDYFTAEEGSPIYDDHVPFLRRGIEVIDLFGYEYPHWHTLADTPDKCDPDRVSQVGELLVDFLYRYPFRP